MGINIEKVDATIELEVLVQFQTARNTSTEGSYFGTFRRPTQNEIDDILDVDSAWSNSDTVAEFLVSVRGIGKGEGEMPADEQLAWVKGTPECVNAGAAAFLRAFRPARYEKKTSRPPRSRS